MCVCLGVTGAKESDGLREKALAGPGSSALCAAGSNAGGQETKCLCWCWWPWSSSICVICPDWMGVKSLPSFHLSLQGQPVRGIEVSIPDGGTAGQ